MIKLNRIGNKLGLAGAIGVLLAAGMVANQMMSEAAVEAANGRVARSQRVIESGLVAQIELRQMQVHDVVTQHLARRHQADRGHQHTFADAPQHRHPQDADAVTLLRRG